MDEMKASSKFTTNTTSTLNVHPKKLNFEHLNDSIETAAKKRRYSDIRDNNNHNATITSSNEDGNNDKMNTSLNNANNSQSNASLLSNASNTSVASSSSYIASPWETRRLKADLLEAKSLIIKLKQEIEQQHNLKAYTEEMYTNKVDSLIKQCEYSSNKVIEMEKHMVYIRKREREAKTELITTKNQLIQQKQMYDDKLYNLQKQYNELDENSKSIQNQLQNQLSEIKRENEHLKMEYNLNLQEFENLKLIHEKCKDKLQLYDKLKLELELEKQEHEKSKSLIKQLQYELSSYGEWKEITKQAQSRLINLSELEKECQRLRSDNKMLHDTIGNKLLLEEQVYDLKQRLEKSEKFGTELAQVKVQVKNLQQELSDWKQLGEDYLIKISSTAATATTGATTGTSLTVNPIQLRSYIEQLLKKDIILTSEKSLKKSEREQFQLKISELQKQNDTLQKSNSDQQLTMKKQKNMQIRIQKKLMIVIKERNFYKQLIENFEKDLTITGATLDAINPPDLQLKARLEILEKSLAGYKEMCANYEKELESIQLLPEMAPLPTVMDTEQSDSYDRLKKEIEQLRTENERLRRRKEELELEMEQRCLKGDFYMNHHQQNLKILHLHNNPANEAYEKHKMDIEKLQAECERLKRKIKRVEDERDEIQVQLQMRINDNNGLKNNTDNNGDGNIDNDHDNNLTNNTSTTQTTQITTTNMTLNIKEMNLLRSKLESMESKMQHMKEIYKQASLEFREVCYMLFGYRVDRIGNANYRISSMYAENENEYLNFRLNESGILDMLETDYSISIGDMVRQHLSTHKSLPAFLSTLTLELFNKTTVMV